MKLNHKLICIATSAAFGCGAATLFAATNSIESAASAPGSSADKPLSEAVAKAPEEAREQAWNWHAQNTDIVQYHPGFQPAIPGRTA